tara:strand:+ start:1040 stop:1198 length:159 start_codon:yes stop_codon:yes gene_type:complete
MKWSKEKVIEFFDANWQITLAQISNMSGWSIKDLKSALMELVDHECSLDLNP